MANDKNTTEASSPRVAIACQGGGSHTAFTAGVLKRLLQEQAKQYQIVALSGTSGGAICALLGWYGLVTIGRDKAAQLLDSFWHENSANSFPDQLWNTWLIGLARLPGVPEVSPYWYPAWGQAQLKRLLEKYVVFEELEQLVQAKGPSCPRLLVSAVEVLSGDFTVFRCDHMRCEVSVDVLLASAAIPTLFRAVQIDNKLYWDGLFSQNPPIREFVADPGTVHEKPDEIWVIQINPTKSKREPKSVEEIRDRRNELAGNLSLQQEISFIKTVNTWLTDGLLASNNQYKPIKVWRIELLRDLDYASKLDRSPSFIQDMMDYGAKQADDFLAQWSPHAQPAGRHAM